MPVDQEGADGFRDLTSASAVLFQSVTFETAVGVTLNSIHLTTTTDCPSAGALVHNEAMAYHSIGHSGSNCDYLAFSESSVQSINIRAMTANQLE